MHHIRILSFIVYTNIILTEICVNDDWPLVIKLWMNDLSYITIMHLDYYGAKGPRRDPDSVRVNFFYF